MIEYKFEYIQYLTHTRHSVIIHKRILEEETMRIKMGVITAITGKSGSGKTSIMYRLGLIENTLGDRYTFNGHQINLWDEEETGNYRGSKISFVYQDNNLFDHLTLKENYDLVTKMSNIQVDYIPYLNMVNLSEALLDQKVNLLSGGERQRATIVLALLKQPELLLLDEPTSALDEMNKENVVKILKKAVSDTNMAVVIITHDLELAKLCDEIYEIKDKHLYLVKSTQEEVLKESKECRRSLIPSKYIKMDYFSNISLYSTLIIILCILLISGQLLIYSGSRFISDKKTSLGKLKDTTLFVVNNASSMVNVQDNMYNTPINNAAYEEIYSNEHIVGVMPVFKLKSTIINSTLGTEHFITIAQEHGYEPHEIWKMLKFDPKKESVVALCDRLNMPVDVFYELYNAYDEEIIDSLYALGFRYQVYEQIVPDDHHTNEFIEWYQETYLDGAYLLNDFYYITVPYSWLKDKLTFCTPEEDTERIFAVTESTREKLTSLIDWKNNKYAQFCLNSETVGDLKAIHYTTYNDHTYPDENPWYEDILRWGGVFPAFLSRMYDLEININSFILLDSKDDLYSDINIPIYLSSEDAYKLLLSGEPAKYYHTNDYQKIYADTSSYIIEIDSIENIQSVVDAICKADPDIGIKYNNEQLTFYEKMIVDLSNFIYYFVALLVLLIIFIMIIIEYKFIQSKTYDIGLFKIYGLSEKKTANLFERMINSALFIIFIISSIVSGVIALLMQSNRFTGVIPIYVIIIGTAVSLIVTSVISHFYIRSVLHKLALNVLLKND